VRADNRYSGSDGFFSCLWGCRLGVQFFFERVLFVFVGVVFECQFSLALCGRRRDFLNLQSQWWLGHGSGRRILTSIVVFIVVVEFK